MHPFTEVRQSLRNWLTQYGWISVLLPFHTYILFGSVGYMVFYEIITDIMNRYIHFLALINTLSYWVFLFGILLTLISRNVKYLPYALLIYCLETLYPFHAFSFGTILRVAIYGALAVATFLYSAKVEE